MPTVWAIIARMFGIFCHFSRGGELTAKGFVHSVESMGLVDGPGVRSVVFMQGCLLRCKYCHNPDTWERGCGKEISSDELVKRIVRFKPYFGCDGGVTFSGGEPLLQADFVFEVFSLLKKQGIHTCLDTAGVMLNTSEEERIRVKRLLSVTDLVLLDIKHFERDKYKEITGRNIDDFLIFLDILNGTEIPVWLRHVVVPELTFGEEHIRRLKDYSSAVKNAVKTELLPYHTMGVSKYKALNIKYPLENVKPLSKNDIISFEKIINSREEKNYAR